MKQLVGLNLYDVYRTRHYTVYNHLTVGSMCFLDKETDKTEFACNLFSVQSAAQHSTTAINILTQQEDNIMHSILLAFYEETKHLPTTQGNKQGAITL